MFVESHVIQLQQQMIVTEIKNQLNEMGFLKKNIKWKPAQTKENMACRQFYESNIQ